jgi:hypothetical protein
MAHKDYTPRKTLNEKSRNTAVKDRELWSANEVEWLESFWSAEEGELEALAVVLGRTVEACRQKHYELRKHAERVAATKSLKKADTWTKGFTSLDEMGF